MSGKRRFVWGTTVFLLILACSAVTVFAADAETEYVPGMYATFWSLIPPVVAIVLALIIPIVAGMAVKTGLIDVILFSINPCYDLLPPNEDVDTLFRRSEDGSYRCAYCESKPR